MLLQNEVSQTEGEKQHLMTQLAIAEKEAATKVSDGVSDKSLANAKVVLRRNSMS